MAGAVFAEESVHDALQIAAKACKRGFRTKLRPLVLGIRLHCSVDVWFPREVSGLHREKGGDGPQASRVKVQRPVGMLDTPRTAQYKAEEKRLPRELRLGQTAQRKPGWLDHGAAEQVYFSDWRIIMMMRGHGLSLC